MNDLGLKVGMLILVVPDIEAAVDFYTRLGLPKRFHLKSNWAEFALGDIKLGICPTSQQLPDRHTGIVLEVADMEALRKELEERGIPLLEEPKVAPHGIMASFKDTGNNIIELYQPTPEKVRDLVQKVVDKEDGCCKGEDEQCVESNECSTEDKGGCC